MMQREERIVVYQSDNASHINSVTTIKESELSKFLKRSCRLLWFFISVVVFLVMTRLILLAIGANPSSPLVDFVYSATRMIVAPFQSLLANIEFGVGVVEMASLFAVFTYPLIGWGTIQMLWMLSKPSKSTGQE